MDLRTRVVGAFDTGDIVILDNVEAHRPEQMRDLTAQAGASMIFLPAQLPDMNPVELRWSKLKSAFKDFGARTVDDLHRAMTPSIALGTSKRRPGRGAGR